MKVGGVLLASGQARRFGANKLLVPVEGVPLCRRAMAALAGAGLDRLAVCSPYPEILAAGENSGFLPLRNDHAAEGISASVRLGLSAMEDLDGVLFAVWTFANLAPRSKSLTAKYEEEFGDEYRELKKKNLIPFIW